MTAAEAGSEQQALELLLKEHKESQCNLSENMELLTMLQWLAT